VYSFCIVDKTKNEVKYGKDRLGGPLESSHR